MNEAAIRSRIDTVMRSEAAAYAQNGRAHGRLGSFNVILQAMPSVADAPNHEVISSRSATVLLRLYSQLGESGREVFKSEMLATLSPDSPLRDLSYLSGFVLYRIGETTEPLRLAIELPADSQNCFGRGNYIGMLSNILSWEYDSFDPTELAAIRELLSQIQQWEDMGCRNKITEVEMRILEDELSDVNPAINADRDKVVSFWQEVFGSDEVQTQIDQIEQLFTEGAFDDAKLATCLSRVRVLLIDSLKRLSEQLVQVNGLAALPSSPEDATVMSWYKEQGVLGDEQKKLIRAVYNLCSTEGSHAASSKKEFARIAKNITYEALVMVIGLVPH